MKKIFTALIMHISLCAFTQNPVIDSLGLLVSKHPQLDTIRVNLLNELTYEYQSVGSELDLSTAHEALNLARTLNYSKGEASAQNKIAYHYYQKADYQPALLAYDTVQQISERRKDTNAIAWALTGKGTVFHSQSNYPAAMQYYLQSVKLFETIGKQAEAASILGNVGVLYKEMGDLPSAIHYFEEGLNIQEKAGNQDEVARFLNNIGGTYLEQNKVTEAEASFMKCLSIVQSGDDKHLHALVLRNLLELKGIQENYKQALTFGFKSLSLYKELGEQEGLVDDYYQLSSIYLKSARPDSAIYYAKKSISLAQEIGFLRNIHNTYEVLAKGYAATNNFTKAYESEQLYTSYKDSLTGEDKRNTVAGLKFQYELDKKQGQIELLKKDQQLKAQQTEQQTQRMYALIAGFILLGLFVVVLVRSNTQKRKDNIVLRQQKTEIDKQAFQLRQTNEELSAQTEEITKQRDHLENTLGELKSAQAQLIQKEKMASLGELTAGIAHEIQNPLNFVNNFSEVNSELIAELKLEISKGNTEEVKAIANDIGENEQKINYHGKRADAIVKGMLQHSRSTGSDKELTDLNDLVDEYLRLSYHGLRAKDKMFSATIQNNFDSSIEKINIIPGDIGRVLLNLFNNAFYAVNERKKTAGKDYEGIVSVSTKKQRDHRGVYGIEIKVKDNGGGIPANILNKIFQPFFTTKPTGQGTGLGLSLSYDIVKAHGGEIRVDTKEAEGTEFISLLPMG